MSQPEKPGTQESAKITVVINKKSKGFTEPEAQKWSLTRTHFCFIWMV